MESLDNQAVALSPRMHAKDPKMVEPEEPGQLSSGGKPASTGLTANQERSPSAAIDDISKRLQELVEKINIRRTTDLKTIDDFQEMLVEKVTEMCQQIREHIYSIYERNSSQMQVQLQQMTEMLDSCTSLNNELLEANQALASLRGDSH